MEKAKRLHSIGPAPSSYRFLQRCLPGLVSALLVLTGCSAPDPEQELRAQLQAMQRAVEEQRPGDFIEAVSDDFAGNDGADRAALHQLLRLHLLGRGNVGVSTGPLQIQMQGDAASVRFTALVSGGSGRVMPDSARAYNITSGWRKDDGKWRVYYAEWKPGP